MAPTTYSGITFPDGDVSFADALTLYDPAFGNGSVPAENLRLPENGLGAPDGQAFPTGTGGLVIYEFTDNVLTGSGDDAPDIHIFEVGAFVEDTFVAISEDGESFVEVGFVTGGTSSLDIDPFLEQAGIDPFTPFRFVRLIDDINEGGAGSFPGADIDAVGAISSIGRIVGGDGGETLTGSEAPEVIDAGSGNDSINAGAGNDTVNAGDGGDRIAAGGGADVINGEGGNDTVFAGAGNDADSIDGGSGEDLLFGNSGDDDIAGGSGGDFIGGGAGNDLLNGNEGNDRIYGGETDAGMDSIFGGSGNDVIFGGAGDDFANGGSGEDEIGGGSGNDLVGGSSGFDTLYGGAGDDTVVGGDDGDLLFGGAGDDFIYLGSTPNSGDVQDGARDIVGVIANNGDDVIYGFEIGVDDVNLREVGIESFEDVMSRLRDVDGNATLDLGDAGSLTFIGVQSESLGDRDFLF